MSSLTIHLVILFWIRVSTARLLPSCSDVTFTITATAENPVYSGVPDPNNETQFVDFVHGVFSGSVTVANKTETFSGTYHIDAVYCRPPSVYDLVHADNILEVLVHGITYNKTYWSGLGFGDYYNWHPFANWRGYHTLAIDRLGHGTNPERPDPFHVVEGALQVEIMHQLIGLLRGGSRGNPTGRKFDKIAYVSISIYHVNLYSRPLRLDPVFSVFCTFPTVLSLTAVFACTFGQPSCITLIVP